MAEPVLVVVTGLPCTGKTTLGLRLAADFHLPFIYRELYTVDTTNFGTVEYDSLASALTSAVAIPN